MRRAIKPLIVAAIALAVLAWERLDRTHITADDASTVTAYDAAPAPDVTFALLDGGTIRLHSLAGHTVLLHFWASWCLPCRTEFGGLLSYVMAHPDMILLAVSADTNARDARAFLRAFAPLPARVLIAYDPKQHLIGDVFQTFQYPETIIIGPDLRLDRKIAGAWNPQESDSVLPPAAVDSAHETP